VGRATTGLEKQVRVDFFDRYSGFALLQVAYRNTGTRTLDVKGWRNGAHELSDAPGGFWSFSGATHEDRRDWVQPLKAGFDQRNSFAMEASDYGGGTPVANIWRRDAGLAVGHVEAVPRELAMPVRRTSKGARIAVENALESTLAPGESLTTDLTLLCAHTGDHFAPLALYQRYMQDAGIAARPAPASAYGAIWCAWGYERNFTTEQVLATPQGAPSSASNGRCSATAGRPMRRLAPRPAQVSAGDADAKAFADAVRAHGMRPAVARAAHGRRARRAARSRGHAVARPGRVGAESELVERVHPMPGLSTHDRLLRGAHAQDRRRVGLRGHQARRPTSEQRRALLQPRAPACASHRLGREVRRVLDGDPQSCA
jgi:alpha-galactosidase